MIKNDRRKEVYLVLLVLLSLYLSLMESIVPKPFPWMKIGLSNIAILIALAKFDGKMALEVLILRILIQSLMLGTIFTPSFIISLISGTLATLFTIFLFKFRKHLSLLSISSLSAFTHNLVQLIIVYFLLFRNISLNSKSIMIFIGSFLFIGIIAGLITGFIVEKLNIRSERGSL